MIFRKAVLFLAALAASSTFAHAQFGVYGTVTVNRLTGIASSPYTPSNLSPSTCTPTAQPCQVNDSVDPLGGTGGVFYDFKTIGPVRLGVDARGVITDSKQGAYTFSRSGGARIYSALGGVRGSFHTPWIPVKPYVQFSAGLARSDYGLTVSSTATSATTYPGQLVLHNGFQYEGFAGVDVRLLPVMDWRVVELGYGAITQPGTDGHTYPVGSLSSGIVFHLPF